MRYPIRVFLVEDHPLIRTGLKLSLGAVPGHFAVVGEADSPGSFFAQYPQVGIDVLLLDISLSAGSGIDIARRLRAEHAPLRILVLSAETDEDNIVTLTDIGVDGFVSKMIQPEELCLAIESVAEGTEYFGKDISRIIRDVNISKKADKIMFTERENEIIALCSEGLAAKEIAYRLNISIDTVNAHKYNIFKKLGINNSVELVRYAIKNGIIRL